MEILHEKLNALPNSIDRITNSKKCAAFLKIKSKIPIDSITKLGIEDNKKINPAQAIKINQLKYL